MYGINKILVVQLIFALAILQGCGMSASAPEIGTWHADTATCVVNPTCSPQFDHSVDGRFYNITLSGSGVHGTFGSMTYVYGAMSSLTCRSFLIYRETLADGTRVFRDITMDAERGCTDGVVKVFYETGIDQLDFFWSEDLISAPQNAGVLSRVP